MPDGGPFTNCTITNNLILEEIAHGNISGNTVFLQTALFNPDRYQATPDAVSFLRINKGIQFMDTGHIITLKGVGTDTKLQQRVYPPSQDTRDWPVLFCTKVNRADRYSTIGDAVLATDKGFFVEKDFSTFGFVSTVSDPEKGYGGGAIQIGTGLTGKNCPPLFNLTGTMLIDAEHANDLYPSPTHKGTTLPSSMAYGDIFWNTTDNTLHQFGYYTNDNLQLDWSPDFLGTVGIIGGYATRQDNDNPYTWWYDSPNNALYQGPHLMFTRVYSAEYDTLFLTRADYPSSGQAKSANLHLGALTAITGLNIPTLTTLDADEDNRPEGSLWLRTDL